MQWFVFVVVVSLLAAIRQFGWIGYAIYLRRRGEIDPEQKTAVLMRALSPTGFLDGRGGERAQPSHKEQLPPAS